jgi:hypothetical protein
VCANEHYRCGIKLSSALTLPPQGPPHFQRMHLHGIVSAWHCHGKGGVLSAMRLPQDWGWRGEQVKIILNRMLDLGRPQSVRAA